MKTTNKKLSLLRSSIYQLSIFPKIFTETWLSPSVHSSESGLHSFNVFRCDRADTGSCSRGGGVMIAVHKSIKATQITWNLTIESIFIRFKLGINYHILGAIYLAPSSKGHIYKNAIELLNNLSTQFSDHFITFCGDFNIARVQWTKNPLQVTSIDSTSIWFMTKYICD